MAVQIEIPEEWVVSSESDSEVSEEGDCVVFEHSDAPLVVTVQGVKEVSYRLDFLGVVENTETDEMLENLWLSSEDFATVSHTRDELFKEAEGWLKSYAYFGSE